jgi:ketosteroid isomerase-like protein
MAPVPAGERFARAIAAKDVPALLDVLEPDVDFRAMTPGRFWEAATAKEVVDDVVLGRWFEPSDRIDALESVESDTVADRERVVYRFHVSNPDGAFLVEQCAYYDVTDDDRIGWLRVMCVGYRPAPARTP